MSGYQVQCQKNPEQENYTGKRKEKLIELDFINELPEVPTINIHVLVFL